jgi:two-component system LytT family response regulator
MIRSIIVDDEKESITALELELEMCCPQIEIIASFSDPKIAVEKIKILQPDLIFLDIEMPGISGFDLLDKLADYNFDVIFVTAYDEFAIKAIKVSAMDYLLKPVDGEELVDAVHKVEMKLKHELSKEQVDILLTNLESRNGAFAKLAIPDNEGIEFIPIDDIYYCKSDGNYTTIFAKTGKYLVSKSLKHFEEILHESNFLRTHQSFLVNINHIRKYYRGAGGELKLTNGDIILVARAKKEELMRRIYSKK